MAVYRCVAIIDYVAVNSLFTLLTSLINGADTRLLAASPVTGHVDLLYKGGTDGYFIKKHVSNTVADGFLW